MGEKALVAEPSIQVPAISAFLLSTTESGVTAMAKTPLTSEQKARRAETARANGAKSRGPKTPAGKYISSLNSIVTGEHLGRLEAEIPPNLVGCTDDDWKEYRRLLQTNARQMKPASECEIDLIRQIAVHAFQIHRIQRIERTLRRASEEKLLDSYANLSRHEIEVMAYKSSMSDEKMWRALQRDRKSHESSMATYRRIFSQLRRDTPMVPPEPVSIAVDMLYEEDPLPPPHIVAEATEHIEGAQSEPSHTLPAWVAKLLTEKELLGEFEKRDKIKMLALRPKLP